MTTPIYPLTFTPIYKDYPWGGRRIPETYNRNVSPGIYAESWEISDHKDGMSIVSNGPLAGQSLKEILQQHTQEILGDRFTEAKFPFLIKLIDAHKKLSVQVHPDDKSASQFGGEAKSEMWYFLGENNADVYCGLQEGVTPEIFSCAVNEGTCAQLLQKIPTKKDDAIFVPGGCVHAIDDGCLILEVQQNSNTTYRVYDWGRKGVDGKPRDLHIKQAMNVIDWNNHADPHTQPRLIKECKNYRNWNVFKCDFYQIEKVQLTGSMQTTMDGTTFQTLFIAEGELELRWEEKTMLISAGTSILIPAALSSYTLEGQAIVLKIYVPKEL